MQFFLFLDLESKDDEETVAIAKLEREQCIEEAEGFEKDLLHMLIPQEKADDFDIILEVRHVILSCEDLSYLVFGIDDLKQMQP